MCALEVLELARQHQADILRGADLNRAGAVASAGIRAGVEAGATLSLGMRGTSTCRWLHGLMAGHLHPTGSGTG